MLTVARPISSVLEPGSELLDLHFGAWVPEAETSVRFDDPQLAISWPLPRLGLSGWEVGLGHVDALERARQWRSHFAQRTFPYLQADLQSVRRQSG